MRIKVLALLLSFAVVPVLASSASLNGKLAQVLNVSQPLRFEPNRGQADDRVSFLARGTQYGIFLTTQGAVLTVRDAANSRTALRLRLLETNRSPVIEAEGGLSSRSNYFVGSNPAEWRTDIPHYARVRYRGVYPGIDVVYYGNERQLEYDFIVAPGADPQAIRFSWQGTGKVSIDAQGDLVLHTGDGVIRQHKPVVYQTLNNGRTEVDGSYVFLAGGQIGFRVGKYDPTKPLVIDPVLSYSSFLGGSGNDAATGVAVDAAGNIYLTGQADSTNFPTLNPITPSTNRGQGEIFISKFNPAGTALVYSTYFGGNNRDSATGLALDAAGNVYVTGSTFSRDLPMVNAADSAKESTVNYEAFVLKLNAAGNTLLFSTYLGGDDNDRAYAIAVDSSGAAYVTGETDSLNFPVSPNAFQGTKSNSICLASHLQWNQ